MKAALILCFRLAMAFIRSGLAADESALLLTRPTVVPPGMKVMQVPFRLLFQAYSGDRQKPESMRFKIGLLDVRLPISFYKIGDSLLHTRLQIQSFKYVIHPEAPTDGEEGDYSELTLINIDTQKPLVLILNKVSDAPKFRLVPDVPKK